MKELRESYFTTASFERAGKEGTKYLSHCGPTAIVNLIMTIKVSRGQDKDRDTALGIFRRTAEYGRRHLLYINANVLGMFGGTFDGAVPFYIKKCLREENIDKVRIGTWKIVTKKRIEEVFRKKKRILYMKLWFHPVYKNHHVLCYGYKLDENDRMLLKIADGWHPYPMWIPFEELKRSSMLEIKI